MRRITVILACLLTAIVLGAPIAAIYFGGVLQ